MKSFLAFSASLMVITSAVGCCGLHRSLSADDPCANELAGKGCCLKKLFDRNHKNKHGCHCGCHAAQCPSMGCDAAPGCGAPVSSGDCGAPMMSSGGTCGCAMPEGNAASQNPMRPTPAYETPLQKLLSPPPNDAPPAPVPAPGADPNVVPAVPGSDKPAPPATSNNWNPTVNKSPQLVSYEEFQRLPGQVVSNASVPAQPAAAPVVFAAPTATPAPVTPTASAPSSTALPIIQPANWVPARSN